jgi:hypothetical protein
MNIHFRAHFRQKKLQKKLGQKLFRLRSLTGSGHFPNMDPDLSKIIQIHNTGYSGPAARERIFMLSCKKTSLQHRCKDNCIARNHHQQCYDALHGVMTLCCATWRGIITSSATMHCTVS